MKIKELIEFTKKIDISEDDWTVDVLDKVEDEYQRGYLTRCIGELGDNLCTDDEEYRESVITYLGYFNKEEQEDE